MIVLAENFEYWADREHHKFPAACRLDPDGKPTENYVVPADCNPGHFGDLSIVPYNPALHKGRIGCPCCGAKLRHTDKQDVVAGSSAESKRAFFSSMKLQDHVERGCSYIAGDNVQSEELRKQISTVSFLSSPGKKILYWDIPYGETKPFLGAAYRAETFRDRHAVSLKRPGENETTLGVHSLEDLLKLARRKPFSDPFWNDVDIGIEGHRIPFSDFMRGSEFCDLLQTAFNRAKINLQHPHMITVNLAPHKKGDIWFDASHRPGHSVRHDGMFYIEAERISLLDSGQGRYVDILPVLAFRDWEILQKIEKGGPFLVHGVVKLNPAEIRNVLEKGGLPAAQGGIRETALRVFVHMNSASDVISVSGAELAVALKSKHVRDELWDAVPPALETVA